MGDRLDQLNEAVEILAALIRNILLKRALHNAESNPHLNFWRLQYGNLMDMAVLDWCKLFGSDDLERQPVHWKNVVDDEESFRAELLTSLGVTREGWNSHWRELQRYRNYHVAHHDQRRMDIPTYPTLDMALNSAFFYYDFIRMELRKFGIQRQPEDVRQYAIDFEAKCFEVAKVALAATHDIKGTVGPPFEPPPSP
jgi:hypothetical protein